jgi:hypothetical protein
MSAGYGALTLFGVSHLQYLQRKLWNQIRYLRFILRSVTEVRNPGIRD